MAGSNIKVTLYEAAWFRWTCTNKFNILSRFRNTINCCLRSLTEAKDPLRVLNLPYVGTFWKSLNKELKVFKSVKQFHYQLKQIWFQIILNCLCIILSTILCLFLWLSILGLMGWPCDFCFVFVLQHFFHGLAKSGLIALHVSSSILSCLFINLCVVILMYSF